ncbi:hypothetical protein [Actinomycetospora termitidis]|uniref:Uncharacterized protein n=1 Tax=Actinomycetospora termitidis TaxID=3053470 RepID=A0ABT7M687_9PSEU|nr:hypothetical protein [Actinomycetospora sp. Odt1-22]MDL5155966.1 hypothetical protein [Actinomycetospora sp. Odt1-22]
MSHDPYGDPTSGFLRNRPGFTDVDELSQVEAEVTTLRLAQLRTMLDGLLHVG